MGPISESLLFPYTAAVVQHTSMVEFPKKIPCLIFNHCPHRFYIFVLLIYLGVVSSRSFWLVSNVRMPGRYRFLNLGCVKFIFCRVLPSHFFNAFRRRIHNKRTTIFRNIMRYYILEEQSTIFWKQILDFDLVWYTVSGRFDTCF